MKNFPQRPRNHVLEKLSENNMHQCVPPEWILNKTESDYGTDFNCEIAKNNQVIGTNFSIQLKAKDKDENEEFVVIKNLKKSTINRWLKRLEPTMIIAYVADIKESFWVWVESDTFDLTKNNSTYQLKVPKANVLSRCDWGKIHEYVEEIFSKRYRLYQIPASSEINKADMAWEKYFGGEFESSLALFNELIDDGEATAKVWNAIAICEYELFNYKRALIAVNNSLELEIHQSTLSNKACILTEYGDQLKDSKILEAAKGLYEQLLEEGRESQLLYNYGNCLRLLGDYNNSKIQYLDSLRIDPNKPQAWKNLGSVYHELGEYETEMNCYNNALALDPNLSEALFSKGVTLFKVYGQPKDGLELMLKGERADSRNNYSLGFPYVYFWIAEAYLALNDKEKASKWNRMGLTNSPTDEYFLVQEQRIKTA